MVKDKMINLEKRTNQECFVKAVEQTTPQARLKSGLDYLDLLQLNYEVEVCYAQKEQRGRSG